uniref:Uncharacterized protein n=1 Tax=Haptolina ericina TaxID=156174 RepID=A0A7S3BSN9_9EUKA|mmetsp:Transcript_65562/g.146296  ORF Transcript_65562/g.146296 Transcript_65562/m.146296 type:complete len:107 (+) Transcript_65562:333-653(+)|eukprot:CAMPEP_0181169652 /NCGR_PEP_ID=MMETSP1096-20121128/930_1 /TAXON_ID=156174 ORGANISM="Chrysochromulina ericina, Strain CCMP281" /NCGR_SAMPLE_ID=MMETSP1096 /ASSEMBLY_ACC=CAM_ASM_000453 /LENGTH=106 /DNA_ID=CAMNT_0023257127 /DNA_START=229 /DNA_END=549 /DNA_ORIENTATION=-
MATIVEVDLVEVEVGPLRIEVLAVNELDRARQRVAKTLTKATQPSPFFIRVDGSTGREQDSDSPVVLRQQATEFDDVVGGTNPKTFGIGTPWSEIPVVPTDVKDNG